MASFTRLVILITALDSVLVNTKVESSSRICLLVIFTDYLTTLFFDENAVCFMISWLFLKLPLLAILFLRTTFIAVI